MIICNEHDLHRDLFYVLHIYWLTGKCLHAIKQFVNLNFDIFIFQMLISSYAIIQRTRDQNVIKLLFSNKLNTPKLQL